MGPKRFLSEKFSLFIVKFKKLGFSAPLSDHRTRNPPMPRPAHYRKTNFVFCFTGS